MTREYAYRILKNFDRHKNISFSEYKRALSVLPEKDSKLLKSLVWGTVRYYIKIDFILRKYIKNYDNLPPAYKTVLRLGIYQLMSGFDEYAAVNETVNLVENKKYRNLVNAVLRNYIRTGDDIEFPEYIKYSYDKNLYSYIKNNFDYYEKILENHIKNHEISLRLNENAVTRDLFESDMEKNGFEIEKSVHCDISYFVRSSSLAIDNNSLFSQGYYYSQNESSCLVPNILNPQKDEFILDACSAPGGKTTYISQLMKNSGEITAADSDITRIKEVKFHAERLKCKNIKTLLADSSEIKFENNFDRILADVPCSSLGTSNTNPEVILKYSPSKTPELVRTQRKILENLMKYLKKDGTLVYSTCTYIKEENTGNMDWLKKNYDVIFCDISDYLKMHRVNYYYDGYGYYIIPEDNLIPFYIAKITYPGGNDE